MDTLDLFGYTPPKKTDEQIYKEYLASAKWKKKRKEAIKRAGNKCEKCGKFKWECRLDVHHLTYDNFRNERPEDLEVVCYSCHKIADKKREQEIAMKNYRILEEARFNGWATKVYGEDWMMYQNEEYVYAEYEAWLERNDY